MQNHHRAFHFLLMSVFIIVGLTACTSDKEQETGGEEQLPSSVAASLSSELASSESSSYIAVSSSEVSSDSEASSEPVSDQPESSSLSASSLSASPSSAPNSSSEPASSGAIQKGAIQIINEQCVNCHVPLHADWASLTTDEDWVSSPKGWINTSDPDSSKLLSRMKYHGEADTFNMPSENNNAPEPYSHDHYEVILSWVRSLKDAATNSSVESLPSQSSSEVPASSTPASSSVSSSSHSSAPIITKTAIQIIDEFCVSCHFTSHDKWGDYRTDADWLAAKARSGENYINSLDTQDSLLLRRMKYYAGGAQSNMPPADNANQSLQFTKAHYDVIANWVDGFTYKSSEPTSDGSVNIQAVILDETGLTIELSCQKTEDIVLNITDPANVQATDISGYQAIQVRETGTTSVSFDAIVSTGMAGEFGLVGEGIDFWQKNVFFNAIRRDVENGQLDITLDIHAVSDVSDDFAKVGILVTDADGIDGKMVFVHWSGRHGLAEDSGDGKLNIYRRFADNPSSGEITPAPAKLRVAYEGDALNVGACFDCEDPVVGLPKELNFEPKQLFIVATSHTVNAISALLTLTDAYSDAAKFEPIVSQEVSCGTQVTSKFIPVSELGAIERVNVKALRQGAVAATGSTLKVFSDAASCEIQDELLSPKLRRLSELQIRNAITDIFDDIFEESVWPNMEDGARLIGVNTLADKLYVNNLNYERLYASSRQIVAEVLDSHSEVSACVSATSDVCVGEVITKYGRLLWRRPLTTIEQGDLATAYSGLTDNREQLELGLNALLLSSKFLFRDEVGQLVDGVNTLSNYEVVSILSFALWNSTPDEALLTLADKASAITEAELLAEIERMFSDERTPQALVAFYKDYLKLDLVLTRPKDDSFNFTDVVRRDVLASAEKTLYDKLLVNPDFIQVFLGNSYYVNKNIDYLFGVTSNDNNLSSVSVASNQREGILNHPAFLSVHSTLAKSGIVKRGVFALEQLLCQELPDPPGDVMPVAVPDGIDPDSTSERELLQIIHSSQAGCFGCHQIIDPAGFGFENFDSIGRYRTTEKQNVAIDASGTLDNVGEHVLKYGNSADYARELVVSPQMKHCVSRRFLENFLGQELKHDACEVKKFEAALSSGDGTVKSLLKALVSLESFAKRK